jgi:sugar lactone lactonase YvrE
VHKIGQVSTIAGSGSQSFADSAVGTSASFNMPTSVAVDSFGNVYVCDRGNSRIRVVSPSNNTSTLAGGSVAFADGIGTSASFSAPYGLALDLFFNVYVADTDNGAVRVVSPAGSTSTLVGNLRSPRGVVVDSSGLIVYVAETGLHSIRVVTVDGTSSSIIAGCGLQGSVDSLVGTAASFNQPTGIAIDASGFLVVADYGNHRIRRISPTGSTRSLAGSGTAGYVDGSGTSASFNGPTGVSVDSAGFVYVADSLNNRVRKVSPTGLTTTLAGTGSASFADGLGTASSFNSPWGVAVDASGSIFVSDQITTASESFSSPLHLRRATLPGTTSP